MSKRQQLYKENKVAKVGREITCPVCGTKFIKKQYSQVFCCGHCKDTFWNAKGDRHAAGYYEDYDAKRPERAARRRLYGSNIVISVSGELSPRHLNEAQERFLARKREIDTYGI